MKIVAVLINSCNKITDKGVAHVCEALKGFRPFDKIALSFRE